MLRLPIYLTNASGAPVTGLALAGADIQVSKAGGAFANGGGTAHEIGLGAYYYELATGEDDTAGELLAKIVKAGTLGFDWVERIPVVGEFTKSQPIASLRRITFSLRDSSGTRLVGAAPAGAELQLSKNGAAFVNGAGTVHELGGGDYYYEATAAELDTIGFLLVRIAKAGALVIMYATRVAKSGSLAIANITPARAAAGTPGAFSLDYSVARTTPIEFDLTGIDTGAQISITMKRADRDETYAILGLDGVWRWPFDAHSTIGDLAVEPVHVSLLPRDGWPPVALDFQVAQARKAPDP